MSTQSRIKRPALIIAGICISVTLIFLQPGVDSLRSRSRYLQPAEATLLNNINNSTLGFEKIFVVGLPTRTDRRDGMTLGAALSNLEIEFIDGVRGEQVPDSAVPTSQGHGRIANPSLGSWRAHMNAIREVITRNLSSALIMEDDADWDVRIRDQLTDFASATNALTQPLKGTSPATYADATYPHPAAGGSPSKPSEFSLSSLPETTLPKSSPYGDNWDLLWLGHCGMHLPFEDDKNLPKARVSWADPTVPQRQYLWAITQPDDLKEQYPDHTRVVHHAQEAVCSLAYAITQKAARQLVYEIGLKDVVAGFDVMLRWFCEALEGRGYHRCLTTQPSLFQHHRPVGPRSAESDISPHGDGTEWRTEAHTNVLRWSVRMNAEELMNGGSNLKDQWPDV